MTILKSLCRLVGELHNENKKRRLKIRLELSPQGIAVQGDIASGFFIRTSRIVLPSVKLESAVNPEGMIVEAINKVRTSLTFPEDRS